MLDLHISVFSGELILGGIRFIVELYDFRKFDGDQIRFFWVNITGLPPDLWKEKEFKRIAYDLEGFFVHVDPHS
jgi:hypothetical protein